MRKRLSKITSNFKWKSACGGALMALMATASVASAAVFNAPTTSSPIALSANNKLLWVVNPEDDTVSVLRTDTNVVLATIPVGNEPRSIALDPNNNFAYVANAAAGTVTVIRITDPSFGGFAAAPLKTLTTGAEPWNIVISPDGKRVFVANSGQDTVTVINAQTRNIIGHVDLRDSLCNDPERGRHFQPRGLAVSINNQVLYVTRFLSFTVPGSGQQGRDTGKEGLVCRFNINTSATNINSFQPAEVITLAPRLTGFQIESNGIGGPDNTRAFPNQLQSIVIRGNKAFMPNIAASPDSPLVFNVDTQAFLTRLDGVGTNNQQDGGSLNLHLGARNPEAGKKRLFFSNPWAIGFTSQSGPGSVYVVSAGSDLLVKLNINANNVPSFTVDQDTTRYIDLNDPEDPATAGAKAGKNPVGIAINSTGTRAWVANNVSGNVSVVNLNTDRVINVVQTAELPSTNLEKRLTVGAEMFFSSRGHFNRPSGTTVSTDERLSSEGWQNCASCHFNGWTDGVVWQFGTGPRKSVNLAGSFNPSDRQEQKVLNYSAIFDEVHDFEANIRNVSGPGNLPVAQACQTPPPDTSAFNPNQGLLIGDNGDIDFAPCVINALTKANAGRAEVTVNLAPAGDDIEALTALKQWVQFKVRVPKGPFTSNQVAGGVNPVEIQQGRALFDQQQCESCHNGGLWSTSVKDFVSPPNFNEIACERDLGANAPPGSSCTTAQVTGNPVPNQFLSRFIEDVGSYNLGVPGRGNPVGGGFDNIGAVEKATKRLVGGVLQPLEDGLGFDFNNDGKGQGFNVQSLLGVHNVQPYMHNGACETLLCVVSDVEHRTANGTIPDVLNTGAKRAKVVKFLESIDAQSQPFP